MIWRTGQDDTAANSYEGFDAVMAAQTGEAWYRGKGFPTDIALIPGKSHLLNGLYGGFIRQAFAAAEAQPALGLLSVDGKSIDLFVGHIRAAGAYLGLAGGGYLQVWS